MMFWKNRVVFVTGGSGFVGRNLIKSLLNKQAKVIAFSDRKDPHLLPRVTEIIGSVEDFESLTYALGKYRVNTIFHLAAQPIVEIGQVNPLRTFEVNIKGAWNILEAGRQNKVEKVIVASTAHVYGNNPNLPFKEEYYPQPSRPYETSKACADLLAQSYADSYNLSVEVPRFVNIYGPGDLNFNRLIPKVIREILSGKSLRIWDLGAVRDFLYIEDVVDAYMLLAEKNLPQTKRVRVFNFGTGKPIKIIELVRKIMEIVKVNSSKLEIEVPPIDRLNEVKKQYVSITKAKRELNWFPHVSLEAGLKKTIDWYKENSYIFYE